MIRNYKNVQADKHYQDMIENPDTLPLAFTYANKHYQGFPKADFDLIYKAIKQMGETEQTTLVFRKDILNIRVTVKHYFEFGGTEMDACFENDGEENSARIENVRFIMHFKGELPIVKGIHGDHGSLYQPYQADVSKMPVHFATERGRPTHHAFPYFNLEYGGGGVLLAIGWAGRWSADFRYTENGTQYTAKYAQGLNTYLKAGESMRSALFFMMPYSVRDEHYATNLWRSWFIQYNVPKADAAGHELQPFSSAFFAYDTGIPNRDGSISESHTTWQRSFDALFTQGIYPDFRWFDAGWFVAPDKQTLTGAWEMVGSWEIDQTKWPGDTFLQSTKYGQEHGVKTFMWFEPERVTDVENLVKNYGYNSDWAVEQFPKDSPRYMYTITSDIGNSDCYAWTIEKVCKVLRENQVAMFREDHNHDPALSWGILDKNEGENRVGIHECKAVDAHYRFLDDVTACTSSYGGCAFTDSCASGGGRNDLQTLRKAVPVLRSDYDRTTTSLRLSMSHGFLKWIPFHGAYTREKTDQLVVEGVSDVYVWRASYLPILNFDGPFTQNADFDFDNLRFGLSEWKKVNGYLLKEYYPLTPWTEADSTDNLISYCFFDAEQEKGVLFAFRQENCQQAQLKIKLAFANNQEYILTDEDSGEKILTKNGEATLAMPNARLSRLLWVEKQ